MPLVVVRSGLGVVLQLVKDHLTLRASLYKNDRTPKESDTIGLYTIADFSGYPGPLTIGPWAGPDAQTDWVKMTAPALAWLHNGGPVDNLIYGVVWTTLAGDFFAAERLARAPVVMDPARPNLQYVPVLTNTAEYPG